jgi:hypothetical protein
MQWQQQQLICYEQTQLETADERHEGTKADAAESNAIAAADATTKADAAEANAIAAAAVITTTRQMQRNQTQ